MSPRFYSVTIVYEDWDDEKTYKNVWLFKSRGDAESFIRHLRAYDCPFEPGELSVEEWKPSDEET
jgi:hypothetical protein